MADENGVAVPDAVLLLSERTQVVARAQTDAAGQHTFSSLKGELHQLKIEKEGFYASTTDNVHPGEVSSLEVTIYHEQEISESVTSMFRRP